MHEATRHLSFDLFPKNLQGTGYPQCLNDNDDDDDDDDDSGNDEDDDGDDDERASSLYLDEMWRRCI